MPDSQKQAQQGQKKGQQDKKRKNKRKELFGIIRLFLHNNHFNDKK